MTSFTPAYGAPEQWLPKRFGQTGPWTDVWGLALTMVEVLAAHRLIDGDQAAMMGTVLDPARRPTPRNEGVDVPDEIESVFACALALHPRDRYAEVGTFWDELGQALGPDFEKRSSSLVPARDRRSDGAVVLRTERIELGAREILAIPDLELGEIVARSESVKPGVAAASPPRPSTNADFELGASVGGPELSIDLEPEQPLRDATAAAAIPPEPVPVARSMRAAPDSSALETLPGHTSRPLVAPLPRAAVRHELSMIQRLWPGSALLVASIIVTLANQSYAASTGDPFSVGPIRATWLAGALMVSGIALLIYRFLPHDG